MFTLSDIKAAHKKVKSGADFPTYVRDLISLGVLSYETFVVDGHSIYVGAGNYTQLDPATYAGLALSDSYTANAFHSALKAHPRGDTDYATFCADCANSGVYKWIMDLQALTCTYYDVNGNDVLMEKVPQ
jgi:uncharacterized protein YbcV (DUF1398 family)